MFRAIQEHHPGCEPREEEEDGHQVHADLDAEGRQIGRGCHCEGGRRGRGG